jgi:hypothetical protein
MVPGMYRGRRLLAILVYMLFLVPSGYALVALVELVLRMGHGIGMYSDYGKDPNEAAFAIAVMVAYAIWLVFGTVTAVLVFKERWSLLGLGILSVISLFVMLPIAVVYLLGVGHS